MYLKIDGVEMWVVVHEIIGNENGWTCVSLDRLADCEKQHGVFICFRVRERINKIKGFVSHSLKLGLLCSYYSYYILQKYRKRMALF